MMTFHEFVRSQRYEDLKYDALKQPSEKNKVVNENKVLSLASWSMTRKKMNNPELSMEKKMAALVDLVAMGAFLNQKEIAKLKTTIAKGR